MNRSFDTLYRQHYNRLYTMVFRMTGSPEDTEDILQNSFLNAMKAYESFRGDSTPFTWLYRITVNTARGHFRKRSRLPIQEYADKHDLTEWEIYDHVNRSSPVEDEFWVERVKQTCLQMFMNCLPAQYRSVYTLRVILEFSVADTAEILDITPQNVKTSLHRARKILKSHFEGRCSLIKKGEPCDCATFAGHVLEHDKAGRILDIRVVPRKARDAQRRFRREMEMILDIDRLYGCEIHRLEYDALKERVKKLRREADLSVLQTR